MPRSSLVSGACAALAILAGPLGAQATAPTDAVSPAPTILATPTAEQPTTAPFLAGERIGFSRATLDDRHPLAVRPPTRQNTVLMIVGGAATITGLLIEEDAITIAGALIWLYGLYRYLS